MKEQQNIDGVPVPEELDIIDVNDPLYNVSEKEIKDYYWNVDNAKYVLFRKIEKLPISEQEQILRKIVRNLYIWQEQVDKRIKDLEDKAFI